MTSVRLGSLLLVACTAACTTSPSDPPLGTGTFALDGADQHVTAVFAEAGYAFFDDSNDSYGVWFIRFSTDPAAAGARCSARGASVFDIDLNTTEVFHRFGVDHGPPDLATGVIPVVPEDQVPSNAPPATPIADVEILGITTGAVGITSSTGDQIAGTFDASGSGHHVGGSFIATICEDRPK